MDELLKKSRLGLILNLVEKYFPKLVEQNTNLASREKNIKELVKANEAYIGLEILVENILDEEVCIDLTDYYIFYSIFKSYGEIPEFLNELEVCDGKVTNEVS